MEEKHSGLGIASFIIGLIAAVFMSFLFVILAVWEASTPDGIDEESVSAMVAGLFLFGFLFVSLLALGLGVAGLVQKERKKVFAILGTVISGLTVLGTGFVLILGMVVR